MGFIRKLTGADQAKKQAKALEKQSMLQAEAIRSAGEQATQAAAMNAQAMAQSQAMAAARNAAAAKAADATGQPLAVADVQLDENAASSTGAEVRKKRAQFGRNYSSGVNI